MPVVRRSHPIPTLFPYTTLFRSPRPAGGGGGACRPRAPATAAAPGLAASVRLQRPDTRSSGRQAASSHRLARPSTPPRSEEHTSELQSLRHLVCSLLLEKNNSTM